MRQQTKIILNKFNRSKRSVLLGLSFLVASGGSVAFANDLSNISYDTENTPAIEFVQSNHISGSVARNTEPHISGAIGQARPATKNEPLFGASEETNNAPTKTTKKESQNQTALAIEKPLSRRDRISMRKTCWAQCEAEFRSSIKSHCADKPLLARKHCRSEFFGKRMMCVRKTCQ